MAKLKTKKGDADVAGFLTSIPDERRRSDAQAVDALLREVTGHEPAMWGESIVGYGSRHLRYDSGREVDWFEVGFSPRKAATTLYVVDSTEAYADELARLGKHTTGKGCLYVKRLTDVDLGVLRDLVTRSLADMRSRS